MGASNGQQGQHHQRRSCIANPGDKPAGNAEEQDGTSRTFMPLPSRFAGEWVRRRILAVRCAYLY
jgi:hypothetical protein